jgi:very-short-patch-repair endonuclease
MQALAAARMTLREKLEYTSVALSNDAEIPSSVRMSAVHVDLLELGELADFRDRSRFHRLTSHDEDTLSAATRLLLEVRNHLGLIEACQVNWLSDLRVRFRQRAQNGDHARFLENLDALKVEALALSESFDSYVATAIEPPDFPPGDEVLQAAIANAAEGKRPFSPFHFGARLSKQAFEQVKVNGVKPRSAKEWKVIADYCGILGRARNLVQRWNKLAQGIGAPTVDGHPAACVPQLAIHAKGVHSATNLACEYDLTLRERVLQVFPTIPVDKIDYEQAFLQELEEGLRIQLRECQLVSSKAAAATVWKILSPLAGDLFSRMREWLKTSLGHARYSRRTIADQWDALLLELQRLRDWETEFSAIREVTRAIEESGAANWAQRLRTEPVSSALDALLPANWRAAWQWSRQRGYLHAIDGRAQILKISRDRGDAETRLRQTYESAIEKRTWLRLVEKLRLDRAIGRAITAYVQAFRGMTKSGKGKRDVKLRYAAREAMHLASGGVPCWIMPHWRVSEALPPKLGDFDLVIVDEASQSDAWAIPCIIRGKKVLIVGDDKQVGPDPSFTRQEQIDQIQERLKIAGLPSDICNRLDPKESIYDLGELVFAGYTIRLREHFRCAEPIIQFSNKLCYDDQIKCIRVPTATERLLPTLVDVHVRTGSRDRIQKINRAEADAIVEEIAMLIAGKNFGERSIGVVSLLGPHQGKLIFDSLLERIGEEAFLKHRIRCGDARTFQGSEADVILISAVDDAESGAWMTVNRLDNIRRINVAVSRARDRLYFFHSFGRNDLSELDLRARLMDHFKAPIQGLSTARGRELCESGFELEMFDALIERGYRVIPQVRAGNKRIDFVIEGHQGKRLAVECDGDQYHGPDKWMDDLGRQRLLERAGWKFWRCWGSSFARDKEGCLDDLIKVLTKEGISPIGNVEVDFTGIVEFREIGAAGEVDSEFEDTDTFNGPLEVESQGAASAASSAISIGDAVQYRISDGAGIREEYIMILNQPSNWKLGIVSSSEPIACCLLGRTEGESFETELDGAPVRVEITMKHEVNT